jgi:hypothetical protein
MVTQSDGLTEYGSPEPGEQRSTDPDEIRREIEATRAELARDVDQLADRTSPKRVAQRKLGKIGDRVNSIKETVMGSSSSAGSSVKGTAQEASGRVQEKASDAADTVKGAASSAADSVKGAASSAADSVRQSPDLVKAKTRGNPLAVGLIAFGAGLLVATLLPETDAERQAGQKLADSGSDLVDRYKEPVMDAVNQVKQDATDSAKESVAEVKDTAQQAAQTTAQTAKESAQDAKETVQSTASNGSSAY